MRGGATECPIREPHGCRAALPAAGARATAPAPVVAAGARLAAARRGSGRNAVVSEADDRTLEIKARLTEAAERGRTVELILVVQGKVRPVGGGGDRWRIRTGSRHVLTFRAGAVVAATPVDADSPRS